MNRYKCQPSTMKSSCSTSSSTEDTDTFPFSQESSALCSAILLFKLSARYSWENGVNQSALSPPIFSIYIGFIIGSNAFIFIQSYFFLLVPNVSQGRQVHYNIIKKMLFSSYTNFFSRVPVFRILNQFSKDLKELDEVVGINLIICLIYPVQLISGIILVVFSTTYFEIIPVVLIFIACFFIRRYYVLALHRITRLEKVTNSPLFSGLMILIGGLTTIRAFREKNYYI